MDFLKSVKIEEVGNAHINGKLLCFAANDSIPHVLKNLIQHNILSAPVVKEHCENPKVVDLVGIVSMLDLVVYLCEKILADKEAMSSATISLFEEAEKLLLKSEIVSSLIDFSSRSPALTIATGTSLFDAIELMVRESAQRLIVVAADGTLLRFITQSAIIRFIGANKDKFQGALPKKFTDIGLHRPLNIFAVKQGQKAIEAFKLMSTERVAAVGVLDDDGKLVGNVSSRDLRLIRDDAEFIHRLYIPLSGFLIKMQKQFNSPDHVVAVTTDNTLADAIDLINKHHIHRVYVVTADNSPVRVVTLTDILELLTA